MKQITFTQLLREPLSIFPIPEEGYEVTRRDGESFIISKIPQPLFPPTIVETPAPTEDA